MVWRTINRQQVQESRYRRWIMRYWNRHLQTGNNSGCSTLYFAHGSIENNSINQRVMFQTLNGGFWVVTHAVHFDKYLLLNDQSQCNCETYGSYSNDIVKLSWSIFLHNITPLVKTKEAKRATLVILWETYRTFLESLSSTTPLK